MSEPRSCVVCDGLPAPLCSEVCRRSALHERDDNLARIHGLRRSTNGDGLRRRLAARNALLTAALVAWRPDCRGRTSALGSGAR